MAWAKFDPVVPLQLLALSKKAADFFFFYFFLKNHEIWPHTESPNSGCNSKNQGQGQHLDKLIMKYEVIITWLYEKANSKFSRTIDFKEG